MEAHVDPRLRSQTSASTNPHLPALPHPSLAENPVRLPPSSPSQVPFPPDPQHALYRQLSRDPAASPSAQGPVRPASADGPLDPKRSRACEPCRSLKVRCEWDPARSDVPCKRCAKAQRSCVITAPSRKRRKKTASRVAELERKIDALTASLQATKPEVEMPSGPAERVAERTEEQAEMRNGVGRDGRESAAPAHLSPGTSTRKTPWSAYQEPRADVPIARAPPKDHQPSTAPAPATSALKRNCPDDSPESAISPSTRVSVSVSSTVGERPSPSTEKPPNVHSFLIPKTAPEVEQAAGAIESGNVSSGVDGLQYEHADVIDRQILSSEVASGLFERYVHEMVPRFPAVVFPKGTTAAEVRKTKPTLFLAIISVAAGTPYADLQKTLTKEVMKVLANRIICNGEKSVEMVQALQVVTVWYSPPEHYDELKFYQLIHMAAVMAIDLGLGKRPGHQKKPKHAPGGFWKEHPWRRVPLFDTGSVEARRTWLTCYFMCAKYASPLRCCRHPQSIAAC